MRDPHHIKTLVHMQVPRLSVSKPVVVIQPVCHIGALLDLHHHRILLDGVNGPGSDLEKITFLYGNLP